jgi:hypothetical protein
MYLKSIERMPEAGHPFFSNQAYGSFPGMKKVILCGHGFFSEQSIFCSIFRIRAGRPTLVFMIMENKAF